MATDAETAQEAIVRFLANCRVPALLEPGEPQFLLYSDNFEYELLNGRLNLRVWDQQRTLFRKVSRVLRQKTGQLELEIERFGKRIGSLQLLDLARPQSQVATRKGNRQEYRERFRRSLSRQYPGWEVTDVSTEPDLEHTLSPSYPRAFLKKGTSGWAAIGAPPEALDVDGVLSFGLIWLDYLRKRERRLTVDGLIVFVPEGRERTTALRLLHLNPMRAAYHLISYTPENYESRVDLRDFGNLETGLQPRRSDPGAIHTETEDWIRRLLQIPGVEAIESG